MSAKLAKIVCCWLFLGFPCVRKFVTRKKIREYWLKVSHRCKKDTESGLNCKNKVYFRISRMNVWECDLGWCDCLSTSWQRGWLKGGKCFFVFESYIRSKSKKTLPNNHPTTRNSISNQIVHCSKMRRANHKNAEIRPANDKLQ